MLWDILATKQEQQQENYIWPIAKNRYLSDFKDYYANK